MSKLIGNLVLLIAGAFLLAGTAIAISIVFMYAVAVVLARKLTGRPGRTALTAGA